MTLFVARQPILDRDQWTVAYELLFRSSWENVFPELDPSQASNKLIHDSMMEFGFEALVGTNQAYVNITRDILLNEQYSVLPTSGVVLELTEDIKPEPDVLVACARLKEAGYRLALDDFVYEDGYGPLLNLADVVKVDFLDTGREERGRLVKELSDYKVDFLAEKVETSDDFREGRDLGYTYFQGFFFCKPEIVAREEVPKFKLNYLRFIQEINRPDVEYDQLEEIIKQEVSLSLKLLRYLNSAALGLTLEVTSIKHALVLLGERHMRKWASAVALASLGEDKPSELAVTGLVRAKFCESVGKEAGFDGSESDMFLMGMLSTVDGLLGRPIEEIMVELPLPEETRAALLGENNQMSTALDLACAFERGEWDNLSVIAEKIELSDERLTGAYREAIAWANQTFKPSRKSGKSKKKKKPNTLVSK